MRTLLELSAHVEEVVAKDRIGGVFRRHSLDDGGLREDNIVIQEIFFSEENPDDLPVQ